MTENDRRRHTMQVELDAYKVSIEKRIAPMEADIKRIREIVEAWNNAKGFVNTVKGISSTIKILAIPAAACAAIWYLITTGHWPTK